MPIYGYHCGRCAHQFEVRQSMSDAPLKDCPKCGGELRKLLYPVGVQFKGSGFYSTDYKNSSEGSKAPAKDSEGKGSEGKGSEGKGSEGKSKSDGSSSSKDGSDGGSGSNEKKAETATTKE